jgi:NADPH2:quinone reductase
MRAAWCDHLGEVSEIVVRDDIPTPVPADGQVLVRVHAAALNFPDVLMVQGRYQVRTEPPFVPGTEFAGEVVGSPSGWATVGTRVTGVVPTGAFGEYAVAHLHELHPLPDALDYDHGAAFQVTYATAYHALVTTGAAEAGQTVVVTGAAGGVGLATVDTAHRLGLRVIAAASSPERLALCRAYGADEAVDYSAQPLKERLKELTPQGIDVVVDPVGSSVAEQALRAMRWGGRFVTVGYAGGEIPRIPLNLVLLKGVIIRGFEMRGIAAHAPEAISACAATLNRLVGEGMRPHLGARFTLDEVPAALQHVAERRALGKVIVSIGQNS